MEVEWLHAVLDLPEEVLVRVILLADLAQVPIRPAAYTAAMSVRQHFRTVLMNAGNTYWHPLAVARFPRLQQLVTNFNMQATAYRELYQTQLDALTVHDGMPLNGMLAPTTTLTDYAITTEMHDAAGGVIFSCTGALEVVAGSVVLPLQPAIDLQKNFQPPARLKLWVATLRAGTFSMAMLVDRAWDPNDEWPDYSFIAGGVSAPLPLKPTAMAAYHINDRLDPRNSRCIR